jgi:hypothetical protein
VAVQESRVEVPFYADDLLPKMQHVLAILADLDARYQTDRYRLENWTGPRAIKDRLLADLEQSYRANRQRFEGCLEELRLQIRAYVEGLRLTRENLKSGTPTGTHH